MGDVYRVLGGSGGQAKLTIFKVCVNNLAFLSSQTSPN